MSEREIIESGFASVSTVKNALNKHGLRKKQKRVAGREVRQLTSDGRLIAKFKSVYCAGKSLRISASNIRDACIDNACRPNKVTIVHGFVFKYKGK
jgi:hypothetical protein